MLTIKKTGEHQYLATLENEIEILDRNTLYLVKKRLSSYLKPHREITLDFGGLKSITNGGYKVLQELLNKAYTKRCKLDFINVEFPLPNKILKMSDKTFKLQKKLASGI